MELYCILSTQIPYRLQKSLPGSHNTILKEKLIPGTAKGVKITKMGICHADDFHFGIAAEVYEQSRFKTGSLELIQKLCVYVQIPAL